MDPITIVRDQPSWHWDHQLQPRLAGLTDDEYVWEPVAGCWNVRPEAQITAPMAVGTGTHRIEFALPEPEPAPVTTIAWRLGHLIVGVLGTRVASHFGGEPMDYRGHAYAATADEALAQLDRVYAGWNDGVAALTPERAAAPIGEAEGEWAEHSMLELVVHINREVIHHGAEIALLRDLYAHRPLTG
ncbi:DinB family protein [Tersicoccus sp. Bi-70]|uniref:DinB family protein n=1 Tax=Tersicoccus sp. Bi-70 TaxID=1897634 RepID=UPI000977D830|nr:DinB family protein [Tersicoccus sp. Bi-70]OMH36624.1 serine/arginine repetitive matrix protein 1 [Tersicoccus sp. Bi-70]